MVAEPLPAPGHLLPPRGDELRVWWARVPVGQLTDTERATLAADLDAGTQARLARFHRVEDRDRGLAAHALLRRLLAGVVGGRPAAVELGRRCLNCADIAHGKPYLVTGGSPAVVELNLSHSGELVCAVLAATGVPVGVDVEERRPVDWAALRANVFSDREWTATTSAADPDRHRTDYWARKESAVKATGHGLSMPLRDVQVTVADRTGWSAELPLGAGVALGHDLDLGADAAAAVAVHRRSDPTRPLPAPVVIRAALL